MTLTFPTFFDPLSPASWPGWCFEFRRAQGLLFALPPTIALGELGTTDPYEYDHAPFDDTWYAVGDGVTRERPLLTLSGEHTYRSEAEAIDHAGSVEALLPLATQLHWRGRFLCDLRPDFPQVVRCQTGATLRDTTFTLTLNTVQRVTRALLAEVQR